MPLGLRTKTLGAVCRRLCVRLLQVGAVLLGVFLLVTVYMAYAYDVSMPEAAKVLVRDAVLLTIQAGVRIYDPCQVRVAELGPGSEDTAPPEGALRAEDYFQQRGEGVRLVKMENETIRRSPFRFSYQPYDEPRLHQLREKYRLDEVIEGASCEFEQMVRLRSWCRSRFRRKDYQLRVDNFDALEVLDRNLRIDSDEPLDVRKHIDPCVFFPLLFSQVLLSMGHSPRIGAITHGVIEVWSNQYKKWVTMDAELDWHYEKDGIPLSMIEMRDEGSDPKHSRVRIVRGNQSSGDANTTMAHLGVEELPVEALINWHVREVDIRDMRNDWLTNHYFHGHPRWSDQNSLAYEDPGAGPERSIYKLLFPHTRNREDMYWTLNQTEIWIRESSPADRLNLVLRTVTPNFDFFEIRIDDAKPVQSQTGIVEWQLHEGENTISIATVNKFRVRGIPSTIKLCRERLTPSGNITNGATRTAGS
jgi:hypothetical protein